jgi:hypothetical protein
MLGPAVVVVAGLYTAWLAIDTDDGLVVGDYYKEGKAINQVLKREQAATELGLTASLRFEAAGHLLRVHLQSGRGADTLPPAIDVRFSHPTRAGLDQTVRLQRSPDGDYVGASTPPDAASWFVLVQDPAGDWRFGGRWAAQADSPPLRLVAGAADGPVRQPIDLPPGCRDRADRPVRAVAQRSTRRTAAPPPPAPRRRGCCRCGRRPRCPCSPPPPARR